jgi:hypothetical protein
MLEKQALERKQRKRVGFSQPKVPDFRFPFDAWEACRLMRMGPWSTSTRTDQTMRLRTYTLTREDADRLASVLTRHGGERTLRALERRHQFCQYVVEAAALATRGEVATSRIFP